MNPLTPDKVSELQRRAMEQLGKARDQYVGMIAPNVTPEMERAMFEKVMVDPAWQERIIKAAGAERFRAWQERMRSMMGARGKE